MAMTLTASKGSKHSPTKLELDTERLPNLGGAGGMLLDEKESTVDFIGSREAHAKMRELMARVATAYSQRQEGPDRFEDVSTVSEYRLQEQIGHLGLFHNVSGYMDIVCIGHPFLYHDAFVNRTFLNKHNVKMDRKNKVYKRGSSIVTDYFKFVTEPPRCGGDAIKTAEAAQWILFYPKSVTFMGTVGGDPDTEDIIDCLQDMSVGYKLENKEKERTSLQLVMRYGKKRSEGYVFEKNASHLSARFIDKPRMVHLLERSTLIFICGRSCLMTGMPLKRMAYFTDSRWKTLCMQLCNGVPLEGAESTFVDIIQYIDLFFLSNKTAARLIKTFDLQCCWKSTSRMALCIHKWIKSISGKHCIVVVYEGIQAAYIASDGKKKSVKRYRSKFYHSHNIVDLYGCESAFSGGYIAQFAQQKTEQECIDCAFFVSSAVATQHGAHFPVNRLQLIMSWKHTVSDDGDSESTLIQDTVKPTKRNKFWCHRGKKY